MAQDLPGQTLSHYRVVSALGAGGMGEVYRATDTTLGRDVALKLLPQAFASDPDRLARFDREAKLLASLNHPNIAHLYGFEQATLGDGTSVHLLAMELVEGEDLGERLRRGPIPVDESLVIARQVAEALEEAHEKGIVHRDLKPANVKVTPDGKVKVLDFGLAKAWTSDAAGVTSTADLSQSPTLAHTGTAAGLILGTAAYMSPEQARGRPVDQRADIWAFGVVLFEMLTGRRLFDGETVSDVLASVLTREPDWTALPAGASDALRQLLRRCLERNPRQRLHHAADARILLDEALVDRPKATDPAATRSRSRRELVAWAVAVLGVVSAVAAGVRGRGTTSPEPPAYRFTVSAPSAAVVSPNGRHLAYPSKGRLWLRSLDQREAVALDRTEAARDIFWSPDSSSIAFFTPTTKGNTLKKVGVGGTPAEALAEFPPGWPAGTWSANGAILVEVTESTEGEGWYLWRPGAPVRRIRPFPADRPIGPDKAFPQFLPDGVHFVFTHPRDGAAWLQVGSIDSDETTPLVRADSRPAYAAPGYLLYVREGVLLAHPFDARRRQLTDEPRKLLDDVAFFAPTGVAGFSVSQQGTLVVRHSRGPSRLTWFDRDGRKTGTLLGPDLYEQLALSPDGRRLAVAISDARTGAPDLWLVDVERGVPSRFTSHPRSELAARWSPDGRLLAFSADWQGPPNVYVQDVAGTPARVLVPFDRRQQYPWSFTPDGASLLYSNRDEATQHDLWISDLQGKTRKRWLATEFSESEAALSPDGRRVAFTSDMTGAKEVYLQSFPVQGDLVRVSTGGGYAPRWRGDGRELYYVTADGQLIAAPLAAGERAAQGPPPHPLFRFDRDTLQDYDVTPDGRRFLLNLGTGGWAGATVDQDLDAGISADVIVGWTRLLKGAAR